jgi:hypothetical protein
MYVELLSGLLTFRLCVLADLLLRLLRFVFLLDDLDFYILEDDLSTGCGGFFSLSEKYHHYTFTFFRRWFFPPVVVSFPFPEKITNRLYKISV